MAPKRYLGYAGGTAIALLAAASFASFNFLLFHTFIEISAIVVLISSFVIALNARGIVGSGFVVVFGASALSVAIALFLHVIAYRGMAVFAADGGNSATQLWLVSRFLLAGALIAASATAGRTARFWIPAVATNLALLVAVLGVFVWDVFPVAYGEEIGLTGFEVWSEWAVVGAMLAAMWLLWRRRAQIGHNEFFVVITGLAFLVLSEIAFTRYSSTTDTMMVLGHVLQTAGLIALYLAVVDDAITRPLHSVARAIEAERSKLAEQVAFLNRVFYDSPASLQSLDADGCFLRVNHAWEEVLGYREADVRGHCFSEYLVEEDAPLFAERFARFLSIGHVSGVTWRLRSAAGEMITASFNGTVVTGYEGIPLSTTCSLVDRTAELEERRGEERYRARLESEVSSRTKDLLETNERLLHASEAKSRFLSNMSHELRTPLNSVIGFSSTLRSGMAGPINEEQTRQLEMIERSGRSLLSMVNNVLDVTNFEADETRLELRPVQCDTAIIEVTDELRGAALAKGLELELIGCERDCEVPVRPLGEPVAIRGILLSLVENAIKFTDHGKVSVAVDCDTELGEVYMAVSDTGPGISDGDKARLFSDFVQLDLPIGMKPAGAGLGLSLSRRLAQAMGGDLTLQSSPGDGSTFTLTLRRGNLSGREKDLV